MTINANVLPGSVIRPVDAANETLGINDNPVRQGESCLTIFANVAIAALGFILANRAFDEYENATEKLEDLANRQLEISCKFHDHWTSVQQPQVLHVLNGALGMSTSRISVGSAKSKAATAFHNAVRRSVVNIRKMYGNSANNCDQEINSDLGMVDNARGFVAAGDRQYERRLDMKAASVLRAYSGSLTNTGPIFNLLGSASSIFSGIQQSAGQQVNSGVGLVGQSIAKAFG